MTRSLLYLAILAYGCAAKAPPPSAPEVPHEAPPPTGDELFAAGRNADAAAAYEHELERGERVVELQVLAVAARLADEAPAWTQLDKLRVLERTYPRSAWGHLAGVLANEIDRATVLRQAVMAAGADLRAAEQRVDQLAQKITTLTAQVADQQAALTALRDERTKLQLQVRDADDRATAHEARIHELEAELAALKQIDLQRAP